MSSSALTTTTTKLHDIDLNQTVGLLDVLLYRSLTVRVGSEPNCITGIMQWVHGTYELPANGSIVMTPFGDGYQQIQDPCAAQSNFIEIYNFTEIYSQYRQFQDATQGLKLHLFEFDGTPVAPLFLLSQTPTMLPTRLLRNVTTGSPVIERRSNGALQGVGSDIRTIGGVVGAAALSTVASLFL